MSKGLVLLSGVNGYIAAVTAKHLLEKGYSVRGTVRKHSSAQTLIDGPLKSYAASGAFTTVEVPDITVPGAFDQAVKGVTTILHLASPVSFGFTDPDPIIHAAVNGTKTMLQSALLAGPQLQSVTVLSSIVSIMNGREAPYTLTEADWNGWAEAKVAELGKNSPGVAIYCASKVAAEKEFWKFRDEVKPAFKMAALNPVFVIGPPLIAPSTVDAVSETIRPIWNIFSGGAFEEAGAAVGWSVDVRDVAKLLEYFVEHPQEVDGERYIAKSAWLNAQAMADAMRKAFPDAVGRVVEGVKGQGYQADGSVDKATQVNIDSSKATKLIGEWIPVEQSVVDTAKSFVGLL